MGQVSAAVKGGTGWPDRFGGQRPVAPANKSCQRSTRNALATLFLLKNAFRQRAAPAIGVPLVRTGPWQAPKSHGATRGITTREPTLGGRPAVNRHAPNPRPSMSLISRHLLLHGFSPHASAPTSCRKYASRNSTHTRTLAERSSRMGYTAHTLASCRPVGQHLHQPSGTQVRPPHPTASAARCRAHPRPIARPSSPLLADSGPRTFTVSSTAPAAQPPHAERVVALLDHQAVMPRQIGPACADKPWRAR